MSSVFKRFSPLRRSDSAVPRHKDVLRAKYQDEVFYGYPQARAEFVVQRDTSFESGSDFSGQFDSSWRRSSMQLNNRPTQPAAGKSSGSKIKNLLRGISIKRTKSSSKLDKKKAREQDGFVKAPHGQFYQAQPANTNYMYSAEGVNAGQEREMSSNLKRSLSLGRVARNPCPPEDHSAHPYMQTPSPSLPYAFPSNVSFPVMAMTPTGPVPVPRNHRHLPQQPTGSRITSCLPFPQMAEEPRQTYLGPPCDSSNCSGTGLRSAHSHESLLTPVGAPLIVSQGGLDIRPMHPSLIPCLPGQASAFSISNASDHVQRFYAARSQDDARQWMDQLKKVNRPDLENTRHKENSLKLWIFEAKNLPVKKKCVYFCEVCLNHTLYARTTSKPKTDSSDPFWGEPFEFSNLSDVGLVTIKIYRQAEKKKKNDKHQIVGEVHIPAHDIHTLCERWYPAELPVTSSGKRQPSSDSSPALRIRARYLSVDVLPLRLYSPLKDFLLTDFMDLTRMLESRLPVRTKEELTCFLVAIFHKYGMSERFIGDLVMEELERPESEAVTFRGNSIATKAMEAYLKLVGSQYLQLILQEPITMVMRSRESCEVDPQRVSSDQNLEDNMNNLRVFVNVFWTKIYSSMQQFPVELRRVFTMIRQRMRDNHKSELCDTVISASIFLRFICPAILGPSLFGLIHELPDPRVSRNLTLIAKTVQSLANFTPFGGKESYMTFMNRFVNEEMKNMRTYLRKISATPEIGAAPGKVVPEIDVGFELAQVHMLMTEASVVLEQGEPGVMRKEPLATLMTLLHNVSSILKHGEMNLPLASNRPPSNRYDNTPSVSTTGGDEWVYTNDQSDTEPQHQPQKIRTMTTIPQSQSHMAVSAPRVPSHQPRMQKSLSLQRPTVTNVDPLQFSCGTVHDNSSKDAVNEEWKRMVSAASSGLPSDSPNFGGPNAASAASTTGSSGYQSFSTTSPIQFYNPTYQKSGLPPVQSHSMSSLSSEERQSPSPPRDADSSSDIISSEDEDRNHVIPVAVAAKLAAKQPPRGSNSSNSFSSNRSTSLKSSDKALLQRPELKQFLHPITPPGSPTYSDVEDVCSDIVGCNEDDSSLDLSPYHQANGKPAGHHPTTDASSWVFSESLPASSPQSTAPKPGVKMGVRSVQRSRQGKSHQDYEKELVNIQHELAETQRQLEKTQKKLNSNENEKAELMEEFNRKLEESRKQMMRQESEKERQLQEIISRLHFLEADLKKEQTPLTDSF